MTIRTAVYIFGILMISCLLGHTGLFSQEIEHPAMELSENENGEQIVIVTATGRAPDPRFYVVKEEQSGDKTILAVYYKPTGDLVGVFAKATIRGKVEGPGVSLFQSRVAPEIEKVIGQKSYEKELKRRYLDLVLLDKADFIDADHLNLSEIDKMVKRKRN
ncbi:MAG: hypothetical protein KDC45_12070 [Bacteroidetes bacterium]|nr:hypothetical protein [Bacteroidota bacterium]